MIVPLVLFLGLGAIVDTSPTEEAFSVDPTMYMALVVARVVLISAAVVFFARAILKQFPIRPTRFAADKWGLITGFLGAVLWIGICHLQLESGMLSLLNLPTTWLPERDGVNPFAIYTAGVPLITFLMLRFVLLAVCVPVAEELFLRGFVMRAVESEDWTDLPLGKIQRFGLISGTVYGVASHPGEVFAAAVWFSLVTWLMVRTGKFWNCVLAHAVTNLILGIYVCYSGQWSLW